MKDQHFASRMLICAGALMSISGILVAICMKIAYGGILLAAAACMFFAARNFRIAEDQKENDHRGAEAEHGKNKKNLLKWICGILAALLIILAAGGWWLFGTFITAANSIEKLEDGLYSMEYVGDYGFDEFLARGGAASDGAVADYLVSFLSRGFYKIESDVQTGEFGCSTICTQDEHGIVFFGRNYDWEECQTMIVHTKPKEGYESISTCCLDFLGFSGNYAPDGSMMERMQTLAAIYVPLDGMNEKGLVVADLMAGDNEQTHQRTDKPDLTTTTAIRLLLDRAANVDEAIVLLEQYDMNSSVGTAHHLSCGCDRKKCRRGIHQRRTVCDRNEGGHQPLSDRL